MNTRRITVCVCKCVHMREVPLEGQRTGGGVAGGYDSQDVGAENQTFNIRS